jgi:DNA-binding NtrC family response regulator
MTKPILIIEDEQALASAVARVCQRLGHDARLCSSGKRGLQALERESFALAVIDIGLPDISGLEVLTSLRELHPSLPVIVITAHGNLENAMQAQQRGASAYLVKPLDLAEVQETLRQNLGSDLDPVPPTAPSPMLVGASASLQRSFIEIAHACASVAPVLISGPTGTGKTHAARVIHQQSKRRGGPFISLHCSTLPEAPLELELFGQDRGGMIESAEGGTLFLDEIADLPPAVQAKLLRFVEERVFTRVGGREERRGDCRLITATSKDLREEVRAGRFREDLYYRLQVLEVTLPPLRERLDDLVALSACFLAELAPGKTFALSPEAIATLRRHDWPGNVRELHNVIQHVVTVCPGGKILPQHLPRSIEPKPGSLPPFEAVLAAWLDNKLSVHATYREMQDEIEGMALRHLLARFNGKPTALARATKMNRVTLRRKWRELGGEANAME